MNPAPIALFVYNRPWHTQQTLEALERNDMAKDSLLYVFADGPKAGADEQALQNIQAVRNLVNSKPWCKQVELLEKKENSGLANSIIAGITEVVNKHGRVIVMEDDLVTSPFFLTFMNEMLELYKDEEKVISIHGYTYPAKIKTNQPSFFLKGADCWGWATWQRGWKLFEPDAGKLLAQIKSSGKKYDFDFFNSYGYTKMLQDQVEGKVNSWAIRWYAAAFLKNRYTLYPSKTLARNIGLDNSGTHASNTNFDVDELADRIEITKIPIKEIPKIKKAIAAYFRGSRQWPFSSHAKERIKSILVRYKLRPA
jgi:hypothetical protein